LQQARERPRLGEPAFARQQEVRCRRRAQRLVQAHALVLEIEALAHGEPQPFGTGVAVEETRRQRERQLVRVADAIVADVPVLGEELREIEVVERRVEHRRIRLVLVRDVDIERARLERLRQRSVAHLQVALEHEPGIEARDRNRVAGMRVGQRRGRAIQRVLARDAGARGEEPRGALPAEGRRRISTNRSPVGASWSC
jgi:hypothetical protein